MVPPPSEAAFSADLGTNIRFYNVDLAVEKGSSFMFRNCKNIILDNVRSGLPLQGQAVVDLNNSDNAFINNCFPLVSTDIFCKTTNTKVIWGNNNSMDHVKTKETTY